MEICTYVLEFMVLDIETVIRVQNTLLLDDLKAVLDTGICFLTNFIWGLPADLLGVVSCLYSYPPTQRTILPQTWSILHSSYFILILDAIK